MATEAALARTDEALTGQTVELLQTLIRNQCVNDGTAESGEEVRNSDTLETYIEGSGLDVESWESIPGRKSMVARIEGSDPDAPSMCWMGHTDVVPVSPDGWSRDPFGGDLVDGEVWGRGAVDMLNVTSSMAVAFRHLADSGFRPKGDLIYFAVADEEAGGTHGAEWVAEHHWDAIQADYTLTEIGGFPAGPGPTIVLSVAEKGLQWRRLKVKGTPGHGSAPLGADNALVTAAEVIRRLAQHRPVAHITDTWRDMVKHMPLPDELRADVLNPEKVFETAAALGPGLGSYIHACTHHTISPNVAHGGVKTNVIPDEVMVEVDIRILPGQTGDEIDADLREAMGDLANRVEIERIFDQQATVSPQDTPLWHCLDRQVKAAYPDAVLMPNLITGGTDGRIYRVRDTVAYGMALFSTDIDMFQFFSRFHGHDERVDVPSLALTTQLWLDVAKDLLG